MPNLPTTGGSSHPAPGGQTPPGRVSYVEASAVGFEHLPEPVRASLIPHLLGDHLAADADEPVAKRRPDGTYYQQATGWWASTDRYLEISATRPLVSAGSGRLRPAGPWTTSTTIYDLAPGSPPVTSSWRFDGVAAGSDLNTALRSVDDPLDTLPPPLVAPVRGGRADAWRTWDDRSAEETVVVVLRLRDRVRILKAERRAHSRRALTTAEWHATALDAPIAATNTFTVGA
jgi:hypothetical protein